MWNHNNNRVQREPPQEYHEAHGGWRDTFRDRFRGISHGNPGNRNRGVNDQALEPQWDNRKPHNYQQQHNEPNPGGGYGSAKRGRCGFPAKCTWKMELAAGVTIALVIGIGILVTVLLSDGGADGGGGGGGGGSGGGGIGGGYPTQAPTPPPIVVEPVYVNLPDASNLNNLDNVRSWARGLYLHGEKEFEARFWDLPRHPSPEEWSDRTMYQIMPDRFNNGDASNDQVNAPWEQREIGKVYYHRHGGDIKGVTDRLDYLKELGVGTIFLTSFHDNEYGAFHGYCVRNFLKIDPGFGTLYEYQTFVREAHRRDMVVIMDYVVNHICTAGFAQQPSNNAQCKGELYAKARDELAADGRYGVGGQGTLNFPSSFFPPLKNDKFFSRCGGGLGGSEGDEWYGDFTSALTDLNTNDPDTRLLMTEMAKYWIAATDIDGFRLDAAKHVTPSFIAHFSVHVRDYALSLGKDNFLVLGEVWSGDQDKLKYLTTMNYPDVIYGIKATIESLRPMYQRHPRQKFPGLTSVYDFDQHYLIDDLIYQGTASGINSKMNDINNLYTNPTRQELQRRTDSYWVFTSQHDTIRLMRANFPQYDTPKRAAMAQALMILGRGVPVLYYGDEVGFTGSCNGIQATIDNRAKYCGESSFEDTVARQTMWVGGGWALGSNIPQVDSLKRIGQAQGANPHDWQNDPYLVRNGNPIYDTVRQMNRLRYTCNALRRGSQWVRNAPGLVAFGRTLQSEAKEAVVVINLLTNQVQLPDIIVDYDINKNGVVYQNMMSQSDTSFSTRDTGSGIVLQLNGMSLGPNSVAVFVAKSNVAGWDSDVGVQLCNDRDYTTVPPTVITPAPTASTGAPTKSPTKLVTKSPTKSPSRTATKSPTRSPVSIPTKLPTKAPTARTTDSPTISPIDGTSPSRAPTSSPIVGAPTVSPTRSNSTEGNSTSGGTVEPTITVPPTSGFQSDEIMTISLLSLGVAMVGLATGFVMVRKFRSNKPRYRSQRHGGGLFKRKKSSPRRSERRYQENEHSKYDNQRYQPQDQGYAPQGQRYAPQEQNRRFAQQPPTRNLGQNYPNQQYSRNQQQLAEQQQPKHTSPSFFKKLRKPKQKQKLKQPKKKAEYGSYRQRIMNPEPVKEVMPDEEAEQEIAQWEAYKARVKLGLRAPTESISRMAAVEQNWEYAKKALTNNAIMRPFSRIGGRAIRAGPQNEIISPPPGMLRDIPESHSPPQPGPGWGRGQGNTGRGRGGPMSKGFFGGNASRRKPTEEFNKYNL